MIKIKTGFALFFFTILIASFGAIANTANIDTTMIVAATSGDGSGGEDGDGGQGDIDPPGDGG